MEGNSSRGREGKGVPFLVKMAMCSSQARGGTLVMVMKHSHVMSTVSFFTSFLHDSHEFLRAHQGVVVDEQVAHVPRLIHVWCNVTYLSTRSLIHEPTPMILEGKPTRAKNNEQNQFCLILYTVVYIIFL